MQGVMLTGWSCCTEAALRTLVGPQKTGAVQPRCCHPSAQRKPALLCFIAVQMVHPLCAISVGAIVQTGSPDQLLFGGGDGSLGTFNTENMRSNTPLANVIPGEITSLSYAANGSCLIVGTANGGIFR